MNYFSKNLKFLTKTKITQSELSRIFNVSRQAINHIINAEDPRASTLLKISKIFKISINDLLEKDLESESLEMN